MNPQKNKGDKAEREAAALLTKATGFTVERRFGAGAELDKGDLVGIPNTVIQVADRKDKSSACLEKPREVEDQRKNAKARYAASLIRWRGGNWRVVLTVEQFAEYVKTTIPE